jgi:hypothetical protein
MLENNIITIDWTDEVLAATMLTHAGKMHVDVAAPLNKQPATKVA